MRFVLIGHLSVDVNVVKGVPHVLYGGGVVHGAVTARRLGVEAVVATKCAASDRPGFSILADAGVEVDWGESPCSTSIRNDYPTDNPDDRTSTLLSGALPFDRADVERVGRCDVLHVNPLWFGEFPPDLLPEARRNAAVLAADAQGFLRRVEPDGRMACRNWPEKVRYLECLDVFKVDLHEAGILTGVRDPREAARRVQAMGPAIVLLTHATGLVVCDGHDLYEAPFAPYGLEGRTGRGDTCTAAFLCGLATREVGDAARFAASVTSRKLQYAGPYRGEA